MRKIDENAREISQAKLESLKQNAAGILAEARRKLLNDQPFVGSVAMNLDIIPTRDFRNPTACTDMNHIYFDIDFLSKLSPEDTLFVLGHEIWHVCMAHGLRTEGREHEMANIAADLEVNQLLKSDGFTVPKMGLMPNMFNFPEGLSFEEYYELLLNNQKNKKNQMSGGNLPMNSSGNSPMEGGSGNSPMEGSGNPSGQIDGQFDKHITEQDNVNNIKNPGNIADRYGKVGVDKDFQPGQPTENQAQKIREICVSAAQTYERSRGTLPAHLKRFTDKLLTPEVNWREILSSFITRTIGDKSCWSRPNRRFVSSRTYLPSHIGDKLKVAVGIDTSGSTSGDIPRFLGELNGLVKSFGSYELTLIECDAAVGKCEKYDDDNPLDLENTKFEMTGGGGTQLTPIFEKIQNDEIDCDCICIFTDGETEHFTPDMDPGIPVLWMVSNGMLDRAKENYDFGEICEFERSDKAA